ncbi:ETX/MTX2 family pore-forming toxin [Enterococcus faecalis]|uniref:ETX/MTX2 family pore-forming toxin n=1 Tax=Enterococcus faecalis TaxID=1351 RepID=UPI003D0CB0B2
MKKLRLCILGSIFSTVFIMFGTKNLSVSAEEIIPDIDQQFNALSRKYFDKFLYKKMVPDLSPYQYRIFSGSQTNIENFDITTTPVGNLRKVEEQLDYVGGNELDNRNGQHEDTLYTASWSKSLTDTVSTSVTKGFKVGGKPSALKIPIKLLGGLLKKTEINAEFNYSTTDTKTLSNTVTFTVPPQIKKVPAGKYYRVEVYFTRVKYAGSFDFQGTGKNVETTINTQANVDPWIPRPYPWKYLDVKKSGYEIFNGLSDSEKSKAAPNIAYNSQDKSIKLTGKANFECISGSELFVKTIDKTNDTVVNVTNLGSIEDIVQN